MKTEIQTGKLLSSINCMYKVKNKRKKSTKVDNTAEGEENVQWETLILSTENK